MATRTYIESSGSLPLAAPAVTASWGNDPATNVSDALPGTLTPAGTARINNPYGLSTTTFPQNMLCHRVVLGPYASITLAAGGTVKGQFLCSKGSAGASFMSQLEIVCYTAAGGVIGTYLPVHTIAAVDASAFSTTLTNRKVPHASHGTTSSVVCTGPWYLVYFIGVRTYSNAQQNARINTGSAGASGDYPEDESTTSTAFRPWVEVPDTLVAYLPEAARRARTSLRAVGRASSY